MPDVRREDDAAAIGETKNVEETNARQVVSTATPGAVRANSNQSDRAPARAKFKRAIFSVARSPSVRAVVFAFALTRLLVFSLFVLTAQLDISHPRPQSSYGAARLDVNRTGFSRIMQRLTSVADCNWYMRLAADGYEHQPFSAEGQMNWAFFPLYPMALRAVALMTGEFHLTGVALSTFFFFFALLLFHQLTIAYGFSTRDANRAVFYLAAFPVSYFFSLPLTESLFLLLTVASFHAAKRERWLVAGLAGALASATRSTGVLLLPALTILYSETYRSIRPRWNFLPLLLIPTGLLSFMLFLHATTGNALAFMDVQTAWGRQPTFFLFTLFDYLRNPLLLAVPWDFRLLNFLAATGALLCGVALLLWRKFSLAAYALLSVVVSLSAGLLQSQARYASVLFPAFIVLATCGRKPRTDQIIRTVFLILLTLMTILFSEQIDIALA
ncbi:MAG: hypothetical protein QOE33_1460 [Acidobacteriota bacterium]|nr:hypothetical protein [Acidobacteriota bacterium]